MTLTTKLSIDQLVEKINNSNDISENDDSIKTPRVETPEPKLGKRYNTGLFKRLTKPRNLMNKFADGESVFSNV